MTQLCPISTMHWRLAVTRCDIFIPFFGNYFIFFLPCDTQIFKALKEFVMPMFTSMCVWGVVIYCSPLGTYIRI